MIVLHSESYVESTHDRVVASRANVTVVYPACRNYIGRVAERQWRSFSNDRSGSGDGACMTAYETMMVILGIQDGDVRKVLVHFERPTEEGFDDARCELPTYRWIMRKGFSDDEIAMFQKLLESNAHLLYRYADEGGIHIA